MKRYLFVSVVGLFFVLGFTGLAAQKVETVNGVRIVHNEKGGLWGKRPQVVLELVRKIGDIEAEDENAAFHHPSDVDMDDIGNIYVLDTGNSRVQKFGPDGKYLATIGRKGQGPGEFIMPESLDIDSAGNLIVHDPIQFRFQVLMADRSDARIIVMKDEWVYKVRGLSSGNFAAKGSTYPRPGKDGKEQKHGQMRLLRIVDQDGRILNSFGELTDFGDPMTNSHGNSFDLDIDGGDAFYVSFSNQNRVEKYSPDGKLLWQADRPLNYGTEVKKKGKIERPSGGGITMTAPEMNACSVGIAADANGRVWVVTLDRQLKKEETVYTSTMTTRGRGGGSVTAAMKTVGDTDLRTTNAYKMEIFAADGTLLGELPLTHFVDYIRIAGDNLFLIDSQRGAAIYHYKIIEKKVISNDHSTSAARKRISYQPRSALTSLLIE